MNVSRSKRTRTFNSNFHPVSIHRCLVLAGVLLLLSGPGIVRSQDTPDDPNCEVCGNLFTYPQLASFQSQNGFLTNIILGQLLGTTVTLNAVNYQGLAQNDISVLEWFDAIVASTSVSSPNAVLTSNVQLASLISAMTTVASNNGQGVVVSALNALTIPSGSIQLGDLLTLNTINNDLVDVEFDFLSLLVGAIQLYNYSNVATTPTPVTATIPGLGDVAIQMQIVEPPHFGCGNGADGPTFYSAGVRLKLDVMLTTTRELLPLTNLNLLLLDLTIEAGLTDLEVYIDIASGSVNISSVNNSVNPATINGTGTPGLVSIFVGDIADGDFFDRSNDPVDLQGMFLDYGLVGSAAVVVDQVFPLPDIMSTLSIGTQTWGDATNGAQGFGGSVSFTDELNTSSNAFSLLASDISTNLDIEITGDGALSGIVGLLDAIIAAVEGDILTNLDALLFTGGGTGGLLYDILTDVGDPLLAAMGVSIGQIFVNGKSVAETCLDFGDASSAYNTTMGEGGPRHVIGPDLYLGSSEPSSDADGAHDPTADDHSDDDGVGSFSYVMESSTYTLPVTYVNNKSEMAQLVGWIDFDNDGTFESSERSVLSSGELSSMSSGIANLMFNTPASVADDLFVRLRVSTDEDFMSAGTVSPNGPASDGEVEDYYFNNSLLPITLVDFGIDNSEAGHVNVQWITSYEQDAAGFEVQRSEDAKNWVSIAWMDCRYPGLGGAYTVVDTLTQSYVKLYYRLKMVDLDGDVNLSPIESTLLQQIKKMKVFPNPTTDWVQIAMPETPSESWQIVIFDAQGVQQKEYEITNVSELVHEIDVSKWSSGLYFVQLVGNQLTELGTFVVR